MERPAVQAGAPGIAPVGGGAPVAQVAERALTAPGHATLLMLSGASGEDVAAALSHLIRPAIAPLVGAGRLDQITGLAWEHDRPFGVLGRLGLPTDLEALQAALTTADPLVIEIAEAHDADTESLRMLSSAVHRLGEVPLLIVLAATRAERDPASGVLGELYRAHRDTSFLLESLDVRGVHELAASLGVVLEESAARRLWQHAEGSPSLVVEVLQNTDLAQWRPLDARMPATPSARRQAERELGRVDADVRALVEACAVLGRWASLSDLGALSQVEDLFAALGRAEAARLLVIRPGLRPQVGFPSRMARAAAYETMGILRRQELHERAGRVLVNPGDALQHRASAALQPDAAVAAALDDHALDCANRGAWREAGAVWLAAHRLATDPDLAEATLIRSVDALVSAGEIVHVEALAPELDAIAPSAARLGVQGYQQLLLGHRHEATELLNRAWAAVRPDDPTTAAMVAHRLALHCLVDWDCDGLLRWTAEAMARTQATGPAGLEARTMRGLGLGGLGLRDAALAEYESVTTEVIAGAQAQRAMMGQGWLHLALDRVTLAAHELALSAPRVASGGSTRVSLWAYGWLARARIALGDLGAAQAAVDRAVPMLERTGQNVALPLIHWSGAEVAALRGQRDRAEHHAARAASVRTDYQGMLVAACMARAVVALAQGDHAAVLRALDPVATADRHPGIDEPGYWPWQDTYGVALVAVGEHSRADAFLRPHEELAAERGHVSSLARLASVRGRLQLASGDVDAGRATFEHALTLLAGDPLAYLRTRIHYGYGQALRRAGKRRDAEAHLTRARRGYATMGADAMVSRCDLELKAGTRVKGAGLSDLTPQEWAVVDLVVKGLSNGEVAASLFVSIKTVQYHLTRVYRRLGIRSRSELVALVAEKR